MNDYYEIIFTIRPMSETANDLLAAFLADIGFESFVTDGPDLKAYISATDYPSADIDSVIDSFPMDVDISYKKCFVEGKDWNEEWEKNYFKPIVIGGKLVIHSSFHKDVPEAEIDIAIDPKMAFGTGHHATTSQVAEALIASDLKGKSLTDVGTGTGILAMLARKLGAERVAGIEIDRQAYLNAVDNCRANDCGDIEIIHGDASALAPLQKADVLVANINRNIILRDLPLYAAAVKPGGKMIFSGFYVEDVPMIEAEAYKYGFRVKALTDRDNWACLTLEHWPE